MIVYKVGEKIKIKGDTATVLAGELKKGAEGIIVALHTGRVEAAFEGLGMVSVGHDLIKKKVRKTEKLVKAKNLKLSDEIIVPGSGEWVKIANIYREDYESSEPIVNIETIIYEPASCEYNELVQVRR